MGSGRSKAPGGSGPRGGQRRPSARPSVRPGQRVVRPKPASTLERVRPQLTGKAAVLVLVLAILMVSYASSFRAYLDQRRELARVDEQIAASQANIKALEREKERWDDPAYVEKMARDKFRFVKRGEIGYIVIDNGQPLGDVSELSEPPTTDGGEPQWYDAAWQSVLIAGNPPAPEDEPEPLDRITAPPSDD